MKNIITAVGALALTTTIAQAGGFERSGNPVGFMFETGNYAELSFGSVTPSVSGVATVPVPPPAPPGTIANLPSGDVGVAYTQVGIAFKMDVNEKLSLGMSIDPSFGADIAYPLASTYPIRGTNAELNGDTLSLIGKYKLNDKFSVLAGLRSVGVGGNVSIFNRGALAYQATYKTARDVGYLVGVAFEKPEIALRVALTYQSATDHSLETTVFGGAVPAALYPQVELPQSLTLDFQSGVAANTLVFGSIRWVDWTATELNSPLYPLNPLVGYDNDSVTYNIGVGRKFNDNWSAAVSLGYEEAKGGIAQNLSPTDGYMSVGLGATYTRDNMKITGGIRYVDIGDARALEVAPGVAVSKFANNSALGVGLKVGFSF